MGKKIRNATDLGLDLDRIAARRVPRDWMYIDGVEPWSMADEALYRAGLARCKGCGRHRDDGPVSPASRYCGRCDSAGLDGRVNYPGEEVGSRIDPDYPAEPTKVPAIRNGLRGGKGRRQAG